MPRSIMQMRRVLIRQLSTSKTMFSCMSGSNSNRWIRLTFKCISKSTHRQFVEIIHLSIWKKHIAIIDFLRFTTCKLQNWLAFLVLCIQSLPFHQLDTSCILRWISIFECLRSGQKMCVARFNPCPSHTVAFCFQAFIQDLFRWSDSISRQLG